MYTFHFFSILATNFTSMDTVNKEEKQRDITNIMPVATVTFILGDSLVLLNATEYYIYSFTCIVYIYIHIYIICVIIPDDVIMEDKAC